MKPLFLIFLAFVYSPFSTNTPTIGSEALEIIVIDDVGRPIIGASVAIYEGDKLITIGITDINGRYTIETELRRINIRISYSGYENRYLEGVNITDETLTVELSPGSSMEEIITIDTKPKTMKKTTGFPFESESISTPMAIASDSKISSGSTLRGYTTEKSLPGSGQITAGEWNDLNNWNDWKELINGEEYKSMAETWNIQTNHRYAVLVLNNDDIPLPGAKVEMLDNKGQLIWQSFTDVSGRAELFRDTYQKDSDIYQIRINYKNESEVVRQIRHVERGAMVARLDVPCPSSMSVDISWVVDATSSMSDEIMYLQSELLDVINRVKSADADIKWSSIFYRDEGDEYVTRIQPFSSNPQDVLNFIKEQEAQGGGDFPEAVSDAVHQMTTSLDWRPESKIKLCFLLLDAPPHQNKTSMDKYRKSVQAAAAKGIKIIPITASGINRETEFLMKFTSILTNGTYVFITDDSGIGNPHLDPVVTDYEVEKLNDLLVRLIQSYTALSNCNQNVVNTRNQDIRFYPNPASDLVNIENLLEGDQVFLISASGKIVKTCKVDGKSTHQMNINDLISGNYILRIKGESRTQDFRLLVIT
ncbi:MAG: T9SS type A sorting domain-containing protein [Saprospiraceae bacterium]|nr:T9SS type A sorting domain-containing protein [Saprospiraceae bacterium]